MSSDSRKDRERLKEEYKEHYRKMREARERLNRNRKTRNIAGALQDMDTSAMMETFDDFLFKVKSKLATVEARLDVAMDSLLEEEEAELKEQERDEELSKARARETLKQVKAEMGMLYSEIEQQASAMSVRKTIGSGSAEQQGPESPETQRPVSEGDNPETAKTVGPEE